MMNSKRDTGYRYAIALIAGLFFAFGFLTWISGILIPYFQICLGLTNTEATFVSFATYTAYFVFALPSASLLEKKGYRFGMSAGLVTMAIGTLLFIPAAYSRLYPLFLTGLFVTGAGITLLQAAVNTYLAVMGPPESTAQRIGIMGFSNKLAGLLGIVIFGNLFLSDADDVLAGISQQTSELQSAIRNEYLLKVVNPYIVISIVLLLLALVIAFSKLTEVGDPAASAAGEEEPGHIGRLTRFPYLCFGVLALFMSTACEGIPVDGILLYSRSLDISVNAGRHLVTWSLVAMMAGYFASIILIPVKLSQQRALLLCSLWGIVFSLLAFCTHGILSVIFLILTSFGASMLWGTIWGLSIRDLGGYTKKGSAILLMAVVGGGLFPLLFGRLLDAHPGYPQRAVLLLLPCYGYLVFFAVKGYGIRQWSSSSHNNPLNNE